MDENKVIHALWLDSLVAIELRGWAKRELKTEVSGVLVLSNASIKEIAATMAGGSELVDLGSGLGGWIWEKKRTEGE